MLYSILKIPVVLILKLLFHLKVFGSENLPKKGGFILACNHRSYLDPIVVGAACSRRLNFMARHDLFRNPWFARLIKSLGAFPVMRDSADKSALKEALRRLKAGKALLVFPEGRRSSDGISFNPQPGVGFLTVKSGVPVIPAYIEGTQIAMPKGSHCIKFVPLIVRFGQQIPLERRLPYDSIAKEIMANINRLS